MLTFKRLLAASSAVVLGAGSGYATSVYAQVTGGPSTIPGNPPMPGAPTPQAVPEGANPASNFRRDANITVMQHPREGYEARGIRVGSMLVFPKLGVTASHDDNIFATSINETDDNIWRIQPSVSVSSDWIRHSLQAYANASFNRYQDNDDENTDEYGFGLNGRLDVTRDTDLTGQFSLTHATEPRTSPNSPSAAAKPVEYDLSNFEVAGRHEFNWLLATGRLNVQKYSYDSPPALPPAPPGTVIDQSYRDRTTTTIEGRLEYALSPATAFFVDVGGDKREYRRRIGISRDSDGYRVHGGVNFEVTKLMRGDIGLGYLHQSFDDPSQKDLEGFSADARLEWLPTQLTTLTFTGNRDIQDSAVPGAAAYISSNVKARVDHELLRNVILSGQVGYGLDEYTGIVREDERTSAGLAASYLINRTVGISATYDYQKQKSKKGSGNNFTDNKLALTLTVQY